jgi:hypothetical protein
MIVTIVQVAAQDFLWIRIFVWLPLVFHFLVGTLPALPWPVTTARSQGHGRSRGIIHFGVESWLVSKGWWPWPRPRIDYSALFVDLLLNTGVAMFITPESVAALAASEDGSAITGALPLA